MTYKENWGGGRGVSGGLKNCTKNLGVVSSELLTTPGYKSRGKKTLDRDDAKKKLGKLAPLGSLCMAWKVQYTALSLSLSLYCTNLVYPSYSAFFYLLHSCPLSHKNLREGGGEETITD